MAFQRPDGKTFSLAAKIQCNFRNFLCRSLPSMTKAEIPRRDSEMVRYRRICYARQKLQRMRKGWATQDLESCPKLSIDLFLSRAAFPTRCFGRESSKYNAPNEWAPFKDGTFKTNNPILALIFPLESCTVYS